MDNTTQESELRQHLERAFHEMFGNGGDVRIYFAPGRVNLIGDHTDYNGGAAMPAALTYGTWFAVRQRPDTLLRMYSENFDEDGIIEGDLADIAALKDAGWARYPAGVVWAFEQAGYEVPKGFDMYVLGTIPNGSGLSSSASVEVGTGFMLSDMYGLEVPLEQIALLGQKAENEFVGVNCGILDQYAIAMGRDGEAIFLTTSPLAHEYAPLDLGDARIIVVSSNKKRGLGDSKYNERRAECEAALAELQTAANINSLGDLTEDAFEAIENCITNPVHRKRARHAVFENQRTIRAKEALRKHDIEEFGRLMSESHASLRDDYEVTGRELDALVESALRQPGVVGARMTGAGFGGCTVNIVRRQNVDDFIQNVGADYEKEIGYAAEFIPVEAGSGPRRVQ